jgi:hypothetical protein
MVDRELFVAEDFELQRQQASQNVGVAWMPAGIVTPQEPASVRGCLDGLQEQEAVCDHSPQLVERSAQLFVVEVV